MTLGMVPTSKEVLRPYTPTSSRCVSSCPVSFSRPPRVKDEGVGGLEPWRRDGPKHTQLHISKKF